MKSPDEFQRYTEKEEKKDKSHPDIADAGDGSCQRFEMKGFGNPHKNRCNNQQENENQDQSLQQTSIVQNASGPEKEIKINPAVEK